MSSIPVDFTGSTADAAPETGAAARHRRLIEAASGLRSRGSSMSADRILYLAGSVLMPFGVLLILLGWLGVSSTTRLYEQIPYAISGGVLGLGFIIGGGFAYFAHWITRLAQETKAQSEQAMEVARQTSETLSRIEELLAEQQSLTKRMVLGQRRQSRISAD